MPFELDRNSVGMQFNLLFKTVGERLLGFRFAERHEGVGRTRADIE